MTKYFSTFIYWICNGVLMIVPVFMLYFLWDIDSLASLAKTNMNLPIFWETVKSWQWYSLWVLTTAYMSIGLVGLYFLRRPFQNFANGELFNLFNSLNLKRFSILLFAHAIATPLYFSLSSVLLSLNHPDGQKVLSVSFGSNEIKSIVLAMIFWVLSNLLVDAAKLKSENQQFV